MVDKFVLIFTLEGANNAVARLMEGYGELLARNGRQVVYVRPEQGEIESALKLMTAGKVAFGLTWLGGMQDLSILVGSERRPENAWEMCGVPLVKMHGDIPAYFSARHGDEPHNSVNLYPADEFASFRSKWMPEARTLAAVIPPYAMAPIERSMIDLGRRRGGKLVFMKNGNSRSELRVRWAQSLSRHMADLVSALAEAIEPEGLRSGPLYIGDFVAEFLAARGIDPATTGPMLRFLTAQMDDYLRRTKSEMIARAMLDLPVIVQGDNWEHVDFTGKRALHRAGRDYRDASITYRDELGVIDMSPNTDTGGHERLFRAAGSYAAALTNRQGWIKSSFPEFDDLMFDFEPESITERVADAIARPDHYLELGIAFGQQFRRIYPEEALAERIVELASFAELQHAPIKPTIQPFFIWPTGR